LLPSCVFKGKFKCLEVPLPMSQRKVIQKKKEITTASKPNLRSCWHLQVKLIGQRTGRCFNNLHTTGFEPRTFLVITKSQNELYQWPIISGKRFTFLNLLWTNPIALYSSNFKLKWTTWRWRKVGDHANYATGGDFDIATHQAHIASGYLINIKETKSNHCATLGLTNFQGRHCHNLTSINTKTSSPP
jgi:hypothetical protein